MAETLDYEGKLVHDPVDHKLGRMPIGELLFKMSFPMMVSMLMQACYNIVDSIFISRVSEAALSALSLAYPVQFLMVALNIGTNVGVTALISRSLGEKNFEKANDYARHGLFLAIIYSVLFAVFGLFSTKPLFLAFTDDPAIQKEGIDYLSIVTIFSFGVFIQTSFEKMMQATGKSVGSMITQLTGAILNIILDPIFIFGYFGIPAMGTKGAAIATVLGQIIGAFVGAILNKILNSDLKLEFHKLKVKIEMLSNIYRIGIPSIIMQSIGSFMIMGLNGILIQYPSAVAVLGVYYKVQSFIFMPLFGLNNGMVPIVSYNFGAHRKDRINSVVKTALIAGFVMMIVGSIIIHTFPDKILALFAASDTMMSTGVHAFKVISLYFPLVSCNIILSAVMQATKRELYSLLASIIRQIVVLLPTAYLLSNHFGVDGVWYCFIISEAVAFLIILPLFMKTYREQIDTL